MCSLDRVRQGGKQSNLAEGCRGRDNTKKGSLTGLGRGIDWYKVSSCLAGENRVKSRQSEVKSGRGRKERSGVV